MRIFYQSSIGTQRLQIKHAAAEWYTVLLPLTSMDPWFVPPTVGHVIEVLDMVKLEVSYQRLGLVI